MANSKILMMLVYAAISDGFRTTLDFWILAPYFYNFQKNVVYD